MAIDNQFGKGIGVAAGFDLGAQKPLDARIAVNTIAERDAHVENNRAYEGMIVFVDETKKNYQLINGAWQELTKAEQDRIAALEAMLNGGEGTEGANGVLGALQDDIDAVDDRLNEGGDIEGRISQNEADIDALEEKTGVKAEFDDEGTQTVQATGMYKYIDDQDAQLRNEIDAAYSGAEGLVTGEKSRAEGQEAAIRQELANALAEAKSHAEAKDLADRNAQATKDSEQDNKILALEQKFQGENSVDNKIAAVQDDLDTFKQAQETAHNGLTQKDGELDQAIKDEKSRAEGIEQGLQNAIDAINNAENGILAQAEAKDQARADAQKLVDDAQDERIKALEDDAPVKQAAIEAAQAAANAAQADADALEGRLDNEGGLVDRIEANEAFVAAQPAVDKAQDDRLALLEEMMGLGGVEGDKTAIEELQESISAVEDKADAAQADVDAVEQRLDAEGGLVDRLEAVENFVDNHDHEAMKGRLDALEAKFEGEQSVDAKIAAAQAAAEAEAARLDGVMQQALQTEIDKKVAKADYDVKMEALDAEDARIAGLVATEQSRAEGVEQAINAEIANMKDATKDGSLAKQIADEKTAREQADNGLDQRLQAVEASIGDGGDLEKRVEANEAAIEIINGEGEGSIKKAVADLVNGAPEALNTLDELAAALRDNADVLTAIETAFDDKLADEKEALQKEIDDDVKVVADELAKQKDASQEGTLAKKIADEAARADAEEKDIRADFAAADTALHTTISAEIDADVKAEADRAKGVEEDLQEAIDAINNAENGILAQAKAHANGLDTAMDLRMDAVEEFVQNHDHEAMEGRIEALENANKENGAVANAIKAAQDAADQAQSEVDAVEKRLDDPNGLVDRLEAVEQFVEDHDDTERDAQIAANKTAIETLNGDENKAGSVAAAVKAEADRAKSAEEAIQKQINEGLKCVAFDGNTEYDDLAPLA